MRDKILKQSYDPYSYGRWYKLFIESDGTVSKITTSDIESAEISGTYIKMPVGFHVLDTVYDITAETGGTASSVQAGVKIYNDGKQSIAIPAVDVYTAATIYVFGYFGD